MPRTLLPHDPRTLHGPMSQSTGSTPVPRPPLGGPAALDRALDLVRFLRANCPWDRKQTAESLVPHLLEETHEVVDAIRDARPDELEGELGDLLLNLAFQIVVAEEAERFDARSVYERLERKMIARHPQLFGNEEGGEAHPSEPGDATSIEAERPPRPAAGARRAWEARKAAGRAEGASVLDGLPGGLDPLTRAHRIQERVAGVGFDWPDHRGALAKVGEELAEVRRAIADGGAEAVEEELGDLLFAVVNLARLAGAHATPALARANRKFTERFAALERLAEERGIVLGQAELEALDALWDEVKQG